MTLARRSCAKEQSREPLRNNTVSLSQPSNPSQSDRSRSLAKTVRTISKRYHTVHHSGLPCWGLVEHGSVWPLLCAG